MRKRKTTTLLEFTTSDNTLRVDKENGVIHGVKVLGHKSLNGRRYTEAAISGAQKLYEGISVNVDHPNVSTPYEGRSLSSRFGRLVNVVYGEDGLRADLQFLKSHPLADMICEAAERMPETLGLSHNADGHVTSSNGETLVEEITRVRSVDLVTDPATTRSLFESTKEETRVKLTIEKVLEDAKDSTLIEAQLLREITDGEMVAPATEVDVPAEGGADAQIKAAFHEAVGAVFDDESMDAKATIKKMKDIVMAYEKLTKKEEPADDTPADKDKDKVPESIQHLRKLNAELTEGTRQLQARDESRELLEAAGVQATPAKLKALVALDSTEDRKAVVDTWEPDTGISSTPRSGSPLTESRHDEFQAPKDAKEFAAQAVI